MKPLPADNLADQNAHGRTGNEMGAVGRFDRFLKMAEHLEVAMGHDDVLELIDENDRGRIIAVDRGARLTVRIINRM